MRMVAHPRGRRCPQGLTPVALDARIDDRRRVMSFEASVSVPGDPLAVNNTLDRAADRRAPHARAVCRRRARQRALPVRRAHGRRLRRRRPAAVRRARDGGGLRSVGRRHPQRRRALRHPGRVDDRAGGVGRESGRRAARRRRRVGVRRSAATGRARSSGSRR